MKNNKIKRGFNPYFTGLPILITAFALAVKVIAG